MRRSVLSLVLAVVFCLAALAVPVCAAETDVAYPSSQAVWLVTAPQAEGQKLQAMEFILHAYALKDPVSGDLTNYVKIRDAAAIVNATPAQFNVTWDGENGCIALAPGPYQSNGTELIQNFGGPQPYRANVTPVRMNGEDVTLESILFTDDRDGGHTYVKLRDIGRAAGFNVSWQNGAIYIDPYNPYDPSN